MSKKEEDIIGALYHPSWIVFTKSSVVDNNYSRIIIYINNQVGQVIFFIKKDIFNY